MSMNIIDFWIVREHRFVVFDFLIVNGQLGAMTVRRALANRHSNDLTVRFTQGF